MRSHPTRALANVLFALVMAAATPILAEAPFAVDPHEHCRGLCAQFYAAEVEKRALCESGCSEAKACMENCSTRFPDEEEKRSRCHARCTRSRGD